MNRPPARRNQASAATGARQAVSSRLTASRTRTRNVFNRLCLSASLAGLAALFLLGSARSRFGR